MTRILVAGGAGFIGHAFFGTYGLPKLVTRIRNRNGPPRHPEKAFPLLVTNAIEDKPLPIYGKSGDFAAYYQEQYAERLARSTTV